MDKVKEANHSALGVRNGGAMLSAQVAALLMKCMHNTRKLSSAVSVLAAILSRECVCASFFIFADCKNKFNPCHSKLPNTAVRS